MPSDADKTDSKSLVHDLGDIARLRTRIARLEGADSQDADKDVQAALSGALAELATADQLDRVMVSDLRKILKRALAEIERQREAAKLLEKVSTKMLRFIGINAADAIDAFRAAVKSETGEQS